MHPVCFEIGALSVRWYGVMAAIGFLLATWFINRNRAHAKMTSDQVSAIVMIAMIAGIIGARIYYVIQFSYQFQGDFWKIFRIDQGGLVFYGGFFLALIAIVGYIRWKKLDILLVFDVFVPALALGHAMGRLGCFLNGCCFGKPTELFCGVVYPMGSAPAMRYADLALHPVQIYEAIANIVLFFVLSYVLKRGRRGVTCSLYFAVYGLMRFVDEFLRGDHEKLINGLTTAQIIGLGLVPVGIGAAIYLYKKSKVVDEVSD